MQAMQGGDVLEDADGVIAVAADLVKGCLCMCPAPHSGGIPPAPPPLGGRFSPGGGGHGGYQQGPTQPPGGINPAQYHSPANAPGHAHVHQQPYLNLVSSL
jgi:hypothetical protein